MSYRLDLETGQWQLIVQEPAPHRLSSSSLVELELRDKEKEIDKTDYPIPKVSRHSKISRHLVQEIEPLSATVPLILYCFIAGYLDAISYSAIFIWCGFQTGNTTQLALALARRFIGPATQDRAFDATDKQALTSLLTFLLGSTIGRVGDRVGSRKRLWLCSGTMLQAVFTFAATIAAIQAGKVELTDNCADSPVAWDKSAGFVALGFMSASLGLQSIMGKRINSQFSTTVVLTAMWTEVAADLNILALRKKITSGDSKVLAIFALFCGGFVGRALLSQVGAPATLGIGTFLRILIAISWVWVPTRNA